MNYLKEIIEERPASEGDQIKAAIRHLFVSSREGETYTEDNPLKVFVTNVNGVANKILNLYKHPTKRGAVVMWYD